MIIDIKQQMQGYKACVFTDGIQHVVTQSKQQQLVAVC